MAKYIAGVNNVITTRVKVRPPRYHHIGGKLALITAVYIFDIPEALAECGLSELKLTDGQKISVQTYYSASIPKDKINDALDWLRDNGHGDLIKNTVSIDYGKGEDNVAADMKQKLHEAGQSFTDKTGVHPQTLKAFAREQTETGKNLPLD